MTALPPHVAAVLGAPAARPAIARALRRVRAEGGVLLAVGPGAVAPEGVTLEPAGRALVGIVDATRGAELCDARSAAAAEHLRAELRQRGAVGLYLDAGQRCAVMPVPLSASTAWDEVRGEARGYSAEHAATRAAVGAEASELLDALAELGPVDVNTTRPASERAETVARLSRVMDCLYLDASTVDGWREAVRAVGADPVRASLVAFDDGVSVVFYPKAGAR